MTKIPTSEVAAAACRGALERFENAVSRARKASNNWNIRIWESGSFINNEESLRIDAEARNLYKTSGLLLKSARNNIIIASMATKVGIWGEDAAKAAANAVSELNAAARAANNAAELWENDLKGAKCTQP